MRSTLCGMCGRFTQTKSRKETLDALGDIELPPLFHRRYNIAPTQQVAIIRSDNPARATESRWGFDNPKSSSTIINAKCETLTERPLLKGLVAAHRCLIPADGFYEWKGKRPYYFQRPEKELFALAGLFRNDRFVIITRAADANMQGIHHRMPIILPINDWNHWLKQGRMPESATLTSRPVSCRVNKVANDDPSCLDPADEQIDLFLFPEGE
jgi:putative SOS response-associated peptidase YedK